MLKVFDETCDFTANTPYKFYELTKTFNSEKVKVQVKGYTCLIHPCCIEQCKKLTGDSYENLLTNILNEIPVRKLFEIYNEPFSEDMAEDVLETAVSDVMSYLQNVKTGKYKKAQAYKNMIEVINGNIPELL